MRRFSLWMALIVFCCCSYAVAQRGGHSSGSRSSKSTSKSSQSSGKTVHVREYTRKDGTVVRAHDRRAPGTAIGSASSTTTTSSSPVRYRRNYMAGGFTPRPWRAATGHVTQ